MANSDPDDSWIVRHQPPWLVFPSLAPELLSAYLTQGETEWWFDEVWRPFWLPLTAEQKLQYCEYWSATDSWRAALEVFEVDPSFDAEQDARESEALLAEKRREWEVERGKLPLWKRWFGRR